MDKFFWLKKLMIISLFLLLGGCAALGSLTLYDMYGPAEPRDRRVDIVRKGQVDYWKDVSPIIEKRCVVCHSCYDAPCQLKLGSIEGIERGASSKRVYDATRLFDAEPTRLFVDAQTTAQWRDKSFHPVLNEHDQTYEANRQAGVMYRLLKLKSDNPLPPHTILGKEFTFGLDRENSCPDEVSVSQYAKDHPLWGMPYALPGLPEEEEKILLAWLEQGALYTPRESISDEYNKAIEEWENFLNQDSLKSQLSSRYIYEHIFLAHIYFDELGGDKYFRLVRSKTPPGEPVDLVATRRPYDDPGVDRVYYRLVEHVEAIVAKTHMPYAFNENRKNRWKELFIDRDYKVDSLQGYEEEVAANPFVTFAQIPVTSRYQFMLDEAQFTVMSFIKGPVCRGQVALNVINDHFWVIFLKPDEHHDTALSEFIKDNYHLLSMPNEEGAIYRPISSWLKYSEKQRDFLEKKDSYLAKKFPETKLINTDLLWDGEGVNDNAALTVFRHFDSATVEKGMLGTRPDTTWALGYLDLERIHYLLVAGYDVYGNVGHQLLSRLYMDFLRMEGESTYLLLLPEEERKTLRSKWYRGADKKVMDFLQSPKFEARHQNTDIEYRTDDPESELVKIIQKKLAPVLPSSRSLSQQPDADFERKLVQVQEYSGLKITEIAQESIILVETRDGDKFYSLLKNNAHLNMTSMFGENDNRVPEEDRLLVMRGFVGSYPNTFFLVKEWEVEDFVDAVGKSGDERGYRQLLNRYGVRRTNPRFWAHSDRVHDGYRRTEPKEFGLLDFNRLENK